MVHALTAPHLFEDALLLVVKLGRNQKLYRLADGIGLGMTEDSRRGSVPRDDQPIERHSHDRVVRGLDDGAQERERNGLILRGIRVVLRASSEEFADPHSGQNDESQGDSASDRAAVVLWEPSYFARAGLS